MISESTHIQTNSTSCINLIFTDKENLSINSGVHSSLHPNCHHQIVHSSFNLNICFKQYIQNERFESDFGFFKALITELNELISLMKT